VTLIYAHRFFQQSSPSKCISCRCCLFNARSIVNKIHELHQLLYFDNYDVLLVTETWLHCDVNSGLLDPCSLYRVVRNDRVDSHHGGVAALVKRSLCVAEENVGKEFANLELLCFDLVFGKCRVRFFVVYRPPYQDQIAMNNVNMLITCLKQYAVSDDYSTNVVIGDFNCPKIDWKHLSSQDDHISKSVLQ